MKRFLYLSFLLFLVIVAGCAKKDKVVLTEDSLATPNNIILTDDQFRNLGIRLGHSEQRSISGVVKANGTLDVPPQNLVTVSAPLGGFVKNTSLLQGMKVKKGQVIITLEHTDYIQLQQDYLENKSQLDFLQLEYQRQEELAKENVNAAKALQAARASYAATRAKVQGLEAKLRLININPADLEKGIISGSINLYAPIDGYVGQVNVNIGMYVNPEHVIFRIIDTNHLHAEAQVFEQDIPHLKIGQKVRFRLSQDSEERTAHLFLIGREIGPERTIRVHCHLDVEDPSLIPGMYFSAVIETDNKTVTALPDAAVINFENKDYIFVVTNEALHQFEMKEVKKGNTESGFSEITWPAGIPVQSTVVTTGAYELLSFLKNKGE